MTEPSGMSETEHQPTYNIGDRVRTIYGPIVVVEKIDSRRPFPIRCAGPYGTFEWFTYQEIANLAHPMSQPARMLLAAWHASGRTLERIDRPAGTNRANINWGQATRRYCTPDRTVDITITTAVQ